MHNEAFLRLGITKTFLLDALHYFHFTEPSKVQSDSIPVILSGEHVLVQGKNGTGKTLAFTSALLQLLDDADYRLQALILSPTREIAAQTFDFINEMTFTAPQPIYTSLSCGGYDMADNVKGLRKGCQIVVGTPGRVGDLVKRKVLKLDTIKILVLDEADELTKMGDFWQVVKGVGGGYQLLSFSATYTDSALSTLRSICPSLVSIQAHGDDTTLPNLQQYHLVCPSPCQRTPCLLQCLRQTTFHQAIIFYNGKSKGEQLAATLREEGFPCLFVSGDMNQAQRIEAVRALRFLGIRVLLSSDLTSRGIDVLNVNLTINYDLPSQPQTYTHRIGRAGRYGTPGVAITLITADQLQCLRSYAETTDFSLYFQHKVPLPDLLPEEQSLMKELMDGRMCEVEEGEVCTEEKAEDEPMGEGEKPGCKLCEADPTSQHCHCSTCQGNYSLLLSLLPP